MRVEKEKIEGLREAYQQWPAQYQCGVSDDGEGFLLNAVTSPRECGCRVTGNGTLQLPLAVEPCDRHKD